MFSKTSCDSALTVFKLEQPSKVNCKVFVIEIELKMSVISGAPLKIEYYWTGCSLTSNLMKKDENE